MVVVCRILSGLSTPVETACADAGFVLPCPSFCTKRETVPKSGGGGGEHGSTTTACEAIGPEQESSTTIHSQKHTTQTTNEDTGMYAAPGLLEDEEEGETVDAAVGKPIIWKPCRAQQIRDFFNQKPIRQDSKITIKPQGNSIVFQARDTTRENIDKFFAGIYDSKKQGSEHRCQQQTRRRMSSNTNGNDLTAVHTRIRHTGGDLNCYRCNKAIIISCTDQEQANITKTEFSNCSIDQENQLENSQILMQNTTSQSVDEQDKFEDTKSVQQHSIEETVKDQIKLPTPEIPSQNHETKSHNVIPNLPNFNSQSDDQDDNHNNSSQFSRI